jgi:hypothetical protein
MTLHQYRGPKSNHKPADFRCAKTDLATTGTLYDIVCKPKRSAQVSTVVPRSTPTQRVGTLMALLTILSSVIGVIVHATVTSTAAASSCVSTTIAATLSMLSQSTMQASALSRVRTRHRLLILAPLVLLFAVTITAGQDQLDTINHEDALNWYARPARQPSASNQASTAPPSISWTNWQCMLHADPAVSMRFTVQTVGASNASVSIAAAVGRAAQDHRQTSITMNNCSESAHGRICMLDSGCNSLILKLSADIRPLIANYDESRAPQGTSANATFNTDATGDIGMSFEYTDTEGNNKT